MGPVAEAMRRKLEQAFAPERLDITDDSSRHAGHRPDHPDGESHFSVTIVSGRFSGLNRVARQRQVHAVLSEELNGPVHALAVKALAPGES